MERGFNTVGCGKFLRETSILTIKSQPRAAFRGSLKLKREVNMYPNHEVFLLSFAMFLERLSVLEARRSAIQQQDDEEKENALKVACQEADIPYRPNIYGIVASDAVRWESEMGVVMAYRNVWQQFLQERQEGPLARFVDGVPLGLCLDISRWSENPFPAEYQELVEDVQEGIGDYDGVVAAAELECVLRRGLKRFSVTPQHLVEFIRSRAKDLGVILPA